MRFREHIIRQRLLELHLTYRDAIRQCGIKNGVATETLKGGPVDSLTWREIESICDTLGISAVDALDWDDQSNADEDISDPGPVHVDDAHLGSLLLNVGRPIPHQAAATLLGTTTRTITDMADRLMAHLQGTGIELINDGGILHLAPIGKAPWRTHVDKALASAVDSTGLSVLETSFLRRILLDPKTTAKQLA